MADLLGTGLSSLRALQRALDTTAHNIANVSTEGYTRQRVDFATRKPQAYGTNWIGSGVDAVAGAARLRPVPVARRSAARAATLARLDAFASQAERLDNLLGDSSNGLGASLQSFTDAINEVSSTPSSISARQVLLAEGNALVAAAQGLRRAPARDVRRTSIRSSWARRARSRRSRRASRGSTATSPSRSSRPASRPTICSTSATSSSTSSRPRSASPWSPKAKSR